MSRITRRQAIGAGVAASVALATETAIAAPGKQKVLSLVDQYLPEQISKEGIAASRAVKFTRLVFGNAVYWVGILDFMSDSVPHAIIAIYAPHEYGGYRRSLLAESWVAGKIEASVDQKTGLLELREQANSPIKGQVVLACNLRTVGTQLSVLEK